MKIFILAGWMMMAFVPGLMAKDAGGFVPLFNGRDLTGWVNANCAPETWSVREGMIHCTGQPTGAMRTDRQYENFILELEWRHLSRGGNSGVFIWGTPIAAPGVPFLQGIEVQVLDHGFAEDYEKQTGKKSDWFTTHGDVFPIHGSVMKPFGRHAGQRSFPSEELSRGTPEWNHYRIVCTNGVLRLSVNGREVSGGEECSYRKGYIALESEGGPVDFRNLRIRELPSSRPAAEQVAPVDSGLRSLFTGLDLRGWKTNAATSARWVVRGERLQLLAGSADPGATLMTEKSFGDAVFIVDVRPGRKDGVAPVVVVRGVEVNLGNVTGEGYQRFVITARQGRIEVSRGGAVVEQAAIPQGAPRRAPLGIRDSGGPMGLMNLYAREL